MHTGLEEGGGGFFSHGHLDDMAAFYAERAAGDVGLIVTGGIAPNDAGKGYFGAAKMSTTKESDRHKVVTEAVHKNGGKIAMQILHTGRYGYHLSPVSASAIKAPIGWVTPRALTSKEVEGTIDDFVKCAELSKAAGYDGVEIMGSEGYFINQFLVKRTNKRTDEWGGSYENRMRLPVEIVKRVRKAVGKDFIIIYRLSMLDLVEDGSSWEEIVQLAKKIEDAGASIINTGIGWHEARVPTIATMVPRGSFTWVTKKMKGEVSIPLCTTNRINTPEVAENILANGSADMVSMARPFLADPLFVKKAKENKADHINTCIGCNQACLDHIFVGKKCSCLVNPRAAHETTLIIRSVPKGKEQNIAVIGAGPAGLAVSTTAAERGHKVTLFEKESIIGGQFNMAKAIPGKEEFNETLRYFDRQLQKHNVTLKLGTEANVETLKGFDAVVVATGVLPRNVKIPLKTEKIKVYSYVDVLRHKVPVGKSVAVIGAGGIGFDVSDFLTHHHVPESLHKQPQHAKSVSSAVALDLLPQEVDNALVDTFLQDWGIDKSITKGGVMPSPKEIAHDRKVYLLQRKKGKLGENLGKTTGWIHRTTMKKRQVTEMSDCKYLEINDDGLLIEHKGKKTTLPVDTVVICAGQEPLRTLYNSLEKSGQKVFMIGGAQEAGELDAKRAIDQGTRLAAVIEDAKSGEVFQAPEGWAPKIMKILNGFMKK